MGQLEGNSNFRGSVSDDQTSQNGLEITDAPELNKGGGAILGLGEDLSTDLFTGNFSYSIPIPLKEARKIFPDFKLEYNSTAGNSAFGLGFDVNIPSVSVRNTAGIPKYNNADQYILSGAGQLIQINSTTQKSNGESWSVETYRPIVEGDFLRIEKWVNAATGASHWKTVSKDNLTQIFGPNPAYQIHDPDDPHKVFCWLISESYDNTGDKINFQYKPENNANVPDIPLEKNRQSFTQKYIKKIQYGLFYDAQSDPRYACEILFDYGEYQLPESNVTGQTPYKPIRTWPARPDPFSRYSSGFEIRTHRLCRNILVFHQFPNQLGAEPSLVNSLSLKHDLNPTLTTVQRVTKTGWRGSDKGLYISAAYPNITFEYSSFAPNTDADFTPVDLGSLSSIPGYLDPSGYFPVDLDAQGIPGIAISIQGTLGYFRPEGDFKFAPLQSLSTNPTTDHAQPNWGALEDIDGNGKMALVTQLGQTRGYFERCDNKDWKGFNPLDQQWTPVGDIKTERVSLNGNGRVDALSYRDAKITYAASKGYAGFDVPLVLELPHNFPQSHIGDETVLLTYANAFGDGLSHRMRISSGRVSVWPDLGWGRFGQEVQISNAPIFGQDVTTDHIYLADIDGSGTADIIIAEAGQLKIYINQSGNEFARDPIIVLLPRALTDISQISFADFLGRGTSSVILTSVTPDGIVHEGYDFNGTRPDNNPTLKPYLLCEIDNHRGARTQLSYKSSVDYSLADAKNDKPWVTTPPFPVQLLARIDVFDQIAGTHSAKEYSYRNGYYDWRNRMFKGFAYVEETDVETKPNQYAATSYDFTPPQYITPLVTTKTWFYNGAWKAQSALAAEMSATSFQGDLLAYDMPGPQLDPVIAASPARFEQLAYAALAGLIAHQEIYGARPDDPAVIYTVPFTVTESSPYVRLVDISENNSRASFYPSIREQITYRYDQIADDPSTSHHFTIRKNPYGDTELECQVTYPRRDQAGSNKRYPEQYELISTAKSAAYTDLDGDARMIGLAYDFQQFQISGLTPKGGLYFSWDALAKQLATALKPQNRIPYGAVFDSAKLQSQAFNHHKTYFWDATQTARLPLGQVTGRGLVYQTSKAVFTDTWLQDAYGGIWDDAFIESSGGYQKDANGVWWNSGLVQKYYTNQTPERFFMLYEQSFEPHTSVKNADGLFVKISQQYDAPYYMRLISQTSMVDQTVQTTTRYEIDYHVIEAAVQTDMNNITSEVLYDPLGQVIATSIFKPQSGSTEREGDGSLYDGASYTPIPVDSFSDVVDAPHKYLQGATTYYYYDLDAWERENQPPRWIYLQRQTHLSALEQGHISAIQQTIGYSDGLGHLLETKQECPAAHKHFADTPPRAEDQNRTPALPKTVRRWRVSGRIFYNNKGKPAAQYLPYFSDSTDYNYNPIIHTGTLPQRVYYDALLREVKIETPKQFFSCVIYKPWEIIRYDLNDTVKQSTFYQEFMRTYPSQPIQAQQDEHAALINAAICENTPQVSILDGLQRQIRLIQNNLGNVRSDAFEQIVKGSSVTSKELWQDLIAQGYIKTRNSVPVGTWVTEKFQPYDPNFQFSLSKPYQQFERLILAYLLENDLQTAFKFDMTGRVLTATDPRLFYENVTTKASYTNFTNIYPMDGSDPASMQRADAGPMQNLVNIYGRIIASHDGRGYHTTYTYDRLQRKRTKSVERAGQATLNEVVTYGDGADGAEDNNQWNHVVEIKDQAGVFKAAAYNLAGELIRVKRQLPLDYQTVIDWAGPVVLGVDVYDIARVYNAVGAEVSGNYGNGLIVQTTQYDIAGNPVAISVNLESQDISIVTGVTYTSDNRPSVVHYGNGITLERSFEQTTTRLVGLQASLNGSPIKTLQDIAVTYDPVGNVTMVRDDTDQAAFCYPQPPVAQAYQYDPIYRLLSATGRQHPDIDADTYAIGFKQSCYASLCPSNPTDQITLINYTEHYQYDMSNNLIAMLHDAPKGISFERTHPVEPASNRLASISYDASGNPDYISLNGQVSLAWDERNLMVSTGKIAKSGQPTQQDYFCYDYAGTRVRKSVDLLNKNSKPITVQNTLYLGPWNIFNQTAVTSGKTEILRNVLRVISKDVCSAVVELMPDKSFSVRYQIGDNLGSISIEADQFGALVSYEEYFAYGGTSLIAGHDEAQVKEKYYRYSGKMRDDGTGLYDYGARYYAPWLGRWLNPDPSGPINGLNVYAFVRDKPSTFTDQDGREISIRRIRGRGGAPDTIVIAVSGILVDNTVLGLSDAQLRGYAARIASQIRDSYTGTDTINWRAEVNIRSRGRVRDTDHVFRFVDDARFPEADGSGIRTSNPVGYAPRVRDGGPTRGGRVVYIREDIRDRPSATVGPYVGTGRTATGTATLERTSAHEFGHTLNRGHPAAGTRDGHLMNQTSAANAGLDIEEDDVEDMLTDYEAGHLNAGGQGYDPRTL